MRTKNFNKIALLAGCIIFSINSFSQSMQDAIKLTGNEQFEKADKTFKSLISKQPLSGALYFYMGENFFLWEKTDSAQACYQKGIDLNATEPLNYVGLGKMQMIAGDSKSALENFNKAKILSKSKDPIVLSKIAEAYIASGSKDYPTAITLLNQAISMDPKNPVYHIDLGDAFLAQSPTDGSKAVEEYNNALSLDPKNVIAMLRTGKLWKNARNYETSYQYFIKAIKLDSTFAPAYREQAEMLYESGRYDEAIAAYRKYLQLNDSRHARKRYGEFLFVAKKYKECDSVLQKVVSTEDSTDPIVFRLLGYEQFERKDCKNGLMNMNKFFKKAGATKVKMLTTDYTYLAKLLSCNGQDSLAVESFNKAISSMPDQNSPDAADLYSQMANIYYKAHNYPKAILYFKKSIQIKQQASNSLNDWYYMGLAQYYSKLYPGADSSFTIVTKLSPSLVGYLYKARANEYMDSDCVTGGAMPSFDTYFQKVGSDTMKNKDGLIEGYIYYAIYYAKKYGNSKDIKDKQQSTVYCKKIQAYDPDNKTAHDILENLNPKPQPKKRREEVSGSSFKSSSQLQTYVLITNILQA